MSVSMPLQQHSHAKQTIRPKAGMEALLITLQDKHSSNSQPLHIQLPLDEVALTQLKPHDKMQKPQPAHVNLNGPFSKRETYLSLPNDELPRTYHHATPVQDQERAQKTIKKNRTIRNIGILGLTAIGTLAVTFAALKTYLWGDK